MTSSQLTMTIGAVSRATGIPVNTLRTWERRYNFPVADRSQGGQRLYSPSIVAHLNLINQALQSGMRPKQVVGIPLEELKAWPQHHTILNKNSTRKLYCMVLVLALIICGRIKSTGLTKGGFDRRA